MFVWRRVKSTASVRQLQVTRTGSEDHHYFYSADANPQVTTDFSLKRHELPKCYE